MDAQTQGEPIAQYFCKHDWHKFGPIALTRVLYRFLGKLVQWKVPVEILSTAGVLFTFPFVFCFSLNFTLQVWERKKKKNLQRSWW